MVPAPNRHYCDFANFLKNFARVVGTPWIACNWFLVLYLSKRQAD